MVRAPGPHHCFLRCLCCLNYLGRYSGCPDCLGCFVDYSADSVDYSGCSADPAGTAGTAAADPESAAALVEAVVLETDGSVTVMSRAEGGSSLSALEDVRNIPAHA